MSKKITLELIDNPENNLGYKIEIYKYKILFEWVDKSSFLGKEFIFYLKEENIFISSTGQKIETIDEAIELGLPFKDNSKFPIL